MSSSRPKHPKLNSFSPGRRLDIDDDDDVGIGALSPPPRQSRTVTVPTAGEQVQLFPFHDDAETSALTQEATTTRTPQHLHRKQPPEYASNTLKDPPPLPTSSSSPPSPRHADDPLPQHRHRKHLPDFSSNRLKDPPLSPPTSSPPPSPRHADDPLPSLSLKSLEERRQTEENQETAPLQSPIGSGSTKKKKKKRKKSKHDGGVTSASERSSPGATTSASSKSPKRSPQGKVTPASEQLSPNSTMKTPKKSSKLGSNSKRSHKKSGKQQNTDTLESSARSTSSKKKKTKKKGREEERRSQGALPSSLPLVASNHDSGDVPATNTTSEGLEASIRSTASKRNKTTKKKAAPLIAASNDEDEIISPKPSKPSSSKKKKKEQKKKKVNEETNPANNRDVAYSASREEPTTHKKKKNKSVTNPKSPNKANNENVDGGNQPASLRSNKSRGTRSPSSQKKKTKRHSADAERASRRRHEQRQQALSGGAFVRDDQNQTNTSHIPEEMLLNHYCSLTRPPAAFDDEEAISNAELSWEPVRKYLQEHTTEEIGFALEQKDDEGVTALHYACRNFPPYDIIHTLLQTEPSVARIQDVFGWLPIHYACACGVSLGCLKSLIEAYPESRSIPDRRGRTPLHFALGNSNPTNHVSPESLLLLSAGGGGGSTTQNPTEMADESGMLPLHYACAYGRSEESLRVLTDRWPEAIIATDKLGRTPLHFALSNAGREAAPAAARLLLSLRPQVVNVTAGSSLPLRFLADYATTTLPYPTSGSTSERDSVRRCLEHLLAFRPDPTADFFTALQSLPTWLRERAVIIPSVQMLTNDKIAAPFPTAVLLSDVFVQLMALLSYSWVVPESIDRRFDEENDNFDKGIEPWKLIPLFLGAFFVIVRSIAQILSFISLGAFRIWLYNPATWLDILYIFVLLYWSVRMILPPGSEEEREKFRTGSAISVFVLYMKIFAYLRNTYVDFAVFLVGLLYVVKRLVAFLICLCVILIAFMQMWYTIYLETDRCTITLDDDDDDNVYCDRWSAFLNAYTMMLGEVDETQFDDNGFALFLFVVFMFLVVILLANILIAFIINSFRVQTERAAVVFWKNRLLFIAEMQALASRGWRNKARKAFGLQVHEDTNRSSQHSFGKSFWDRLMTFFEDDLFDLGLIEKICSIMVRLAVALVIIPVWLLIGLLSFGTLWPPQVREAFFTSTVLANSSDEEKENELRNEQVKILKDEVGSLKDGLKEELAINRTHVFQLKSRVAERKLEVQAESKQIKRIIAMLFEQRASTDYDD